MTRATPPMTMAVSAPMTKAASRSVATAASAVLGARGVVSVTGAANLGLTRARCPRARRKPMRPRVLDFSASDRWFPTSESRGGSHGAVHQDREHYRSRSGRGEVRRGGGEEDRALQSRRDLLCHRRHLYAPRGPALGGRGVG